MRPRIFIGSSRESMSIASAVNSSLQAVAFSKTWFDGVFDLSVGTIKNLMKEVERSDFGIFVFSRDDEAVVRGKVLGIPRDNVVYELGLFSGALGTDRCFFLLAQGENVHIPTDLLGLTAGTYDPDWHEDELDAAVAPFCNKVKESLRKLGYRHRAVHSKLYELITEYACAEWIKELDDRVREKGRIFDDMVDFCKKNPVNKKTLFTERSPGAYFALAAAICARPQIKDHEIIMSIRARDVARGQLQAKLVEAMRALKDANFLTREQSVHLSGWAARFQDPDPSLASQLRLFVG